MASKISASVGRKAKNQPEDVKTIQGLLNGFASKFSLPKLKVDGVADPKLEQAIAKFQQDVCGMKPDHRVDPGRDTIKKLLAGPAKAEAEQKAKEKAFQKEVLAEVDRVRKAAQTFAEKAVKSAGLSADAMKMLNTSLAGLEHFVLNPVLQSVEYGKTEIADVRAAANMFLKQAEGVIKTEVSGMTKKRDEVIKEILAQRDKIREALIAKAKQQAKAAGLPVEAAEKMYADIEGAVKKALDDALPSEDKALDFSPKDIANLAQKAAKQGETLIKMAVGNALKVRAMILKTIAMERNNTLNALRKVAEAQAKKAGLPLKSVEMLYGKYEKIAKEQFDNFTGSDKELYGVEVKDVAKFAGKVMKEVEGGVKAIATEAAKKRENVRKDLIGKVKSQAKAMKLGADKVSEIMGDIEAFADAQWDWLMGRSSGGDVAEVGKMAGDVAKEGSNHISDLLKDAAREDRGGESGEGAKTPLLLRGAEEGIKQGGFSFKVSGVSPDPKAKVLLIVGKPSLQLDITKGFSKANMVELFKLIDQGNLWTSTIDFYAIETTDGKPDPKTKSKTVSLRAPVAPFKGTVSFAGLGADKGMTYTGNGKGRYLYTTPINGWYFLKYGPEFERDPKMRGFDCITYVGSAKKKMSGMSGRGDGLASAIGAKKVNLENVSKEKVVEYFKGDGKTGDYIAWWSTHCIAVIGGTVHEFSQSKKGFNTAKATSYGWPKTGNYVRKM